MESRHVLVAVLSQLHGQQLEIARRMLEDARTLVDVQQRASTVLNQLRSVRPDSPLSPPQSAAAAPPPGSGPRYLRFAEVSQRIGLSRSSVWRMERRAGSSGSVSQSSNLTAGSKRKSKPGCGIDRLARETLDEIILSWTQLDP